jgi:hypothetical protein
MQRNHKPTSTNTRANLLVLHVHGDEGEVLLALGVVAWRQQLVADGAAEAVADEVLLLAALQSTLQTLEEHRQELTRVLLHADVRGVTLPVLRTQTSDATAAASAHTLQQSQGAPQRQ